MKLSENAGIWFGVGLMGTALLILILTLCFQPKSSQVNEVTTDSLAGIITWREYKKRLNDTAAKYIPCIYIDSTGRHVVNNCAEIIKEK